MCTGGMCMCDLTYIYWVIKMLIQNVASINLDTKDRMKPIDWARLEGQDHIVHIFAEIGSSICLELRQQEHTRGVLRRENGPLVFMLGDYEVVGLITSSSNNEIVSTTTSRNF